MTKHFKGLDTLRALAALIVVVGHIELLKSRSHIANLMDSNAAVFPSGHIAVILFFVLSGFLITYLLVKEVEAHGRISFKNFYMRRILRIWPLYYLIIILSSVLIESEQSWTSIALSLSIFPNVAHAMGEEWLASPQIWSIGVEEQFYLFWPLLITLVPLRRLPAFLILFFFSFTILPYFLGFINARTLQSGYIGVIEKIFYGTKFNCMSIGAFIGFAYAKNKSWTKFFGQNKVLVPIGLITLLLWFLKFELQHFSDEFYTLLFAMVILGLIDKNTINIDIRASKFLGKISYGIYMYHWIVIVLVLKYLPIIENLYTYNLVLYALVLFITMVLSWASYTYFESAFLRLRSNYQRDTG